MNVPKLLPVTVAMAAVALVLAHPASRVSGPAAAHQPALSSASLPTGTLDPRHLPAVLPHGVFRASTSAPARTLSGPSTDPLLTSDLAIYVSDGSDYTTLAAEGHLSLSSNDGGVHYVGTFVDDFAGGGPYWASATGVGPTTLNGDYRIDTGNGTMTFHIGGTFTSRVPAKYGTAAKIGTILYGAHAWTARAPLNVTLGSFTIGAFHPKATGTLNLTTDALGYIVPFFAPGHVNSSWSYLSAGRLHSYYINSFGRYFPADGAGDGSLTTVLGVGKTIYAIVGAKEGSGTDKIISGDALAGSGPFTSQAAFTAQ